VKRKRYRPDAVLSRLIGALESEDDQAHRIAIVELLQRGPLICEGVIGRIDRTDQNGDILTLRAVLLGFLRSIVRDSQFGRFSQGIGTYKAMNFRANTGAVTSCAVDGDLHDVAVLQLITLLHIVGLGDVRECSAPDCQRLYVKAYRREFCSPRCQKRTHTRQWRQEEKRAREARQVRGKRVKAKH
jgi:hypothetical protein